MDRTKTGVLRRGRNLSRKRMRNGRDLAGGATHPVIRHRSGERETIFDDVEPIHRVFRRGDPTPRSESAHRGEIAFTATQEIVVEREDDIGAIKSRNEPVFSPKLICVLKALRAD